MSPENRSPSFWTKLVKKGGKQMINGKRILVALDDGHGVDTAGKRTPTLPGGQKSEIGRPYMNENLFNRAVIAYTKQELENNGFDVLLVAPTDADTPLATRTNLANAKGADIYISVHANAISGQWGTWGGIETFYYPSPQSRRLADILHKHVMNGTPFKNRGLKNGSHLWVLRKANMPSVLLELGFMDSLIDYKELLKDTYRKESATEITKGVCEYFGVKYQAVKGSTASVPAAPPKSEPAKPKPVSSDSPFLKTGSQGAAVKELQTLLTKHGFTVAVDGGFGPATEKAVKKFQESKKITVDGLVGDGTWKELRKPVPAKAPAPDPKVDINKGIGMVRVQSDKLNLRKDHSPTSSIIRTLAKGELYYAYAREGIWYNLGSGWVSAGSDGSLVTFTPHPGKAVPEPIINTKPTAPSPKPAAKPAVNDLNDGILFRVIAGSFPTIKDANARIALLKSHGIAAYVTPFHDAGKTHYRVVAGTFDARQNAENQVAKLAGLSITSFLLAVKK